MKVKVLVSQLCLTLCDPMDWSPPGSSVHGILQARILEWVVMFFSRGSSWLRDLTQMFLIAGNDGSNDHKPAFGLSSRDRFCLCVLPPLSLQNICEMMFLQFCRWPKWSPERSSLAQWQPELATRTSHIDILLQNMCSFVQRWVTSAGLRVLSLENFACKVDQETGSPYGHAGERW